MAHLEYMLGKSRRRLTDTVNEFVHMEADRLCDVVERFSGYLGPLVGIREESEMVGDSYENWLPWQVLTDEERDAIEAEARRQMDRLRPLRKAYEDEHWDGLYLLTEVCQRNYSLHVDQDGKTNAASTTGYGYEFEEFFGKRGRALNPPGVTNMQLYEHEARVLREEITPRNEAERPWLDAYYAVPRHVPDWVYDEARRRAALEKQSAELKQEQVSPA